MVTLKKKKKELTEDEKRTKKRKAPNVDITIEGQGTSTTRRGVRPPPAGVGSNISIAKTQEELRSGPEFIPTGEQQFNKKLVTPRNILTEGGLSGISEEDFARIQAQQQGSLGGRLSEDISNPPDLSPEKGGFTDKVANIGLELAPVPVESLQNIFAALTGREKLTTKEIAKTNFGKAVGLTVAGVDVAAVGVGAYFALPAVTAAVAGTSIGASIVGVTGSSTALTSSIVGLGVFFGAKNLLDIEGDEMNQYRQSLKKVVEDGERIEAAVRNGMPPGQAMELLGTMEQEVAFAETRLKELGIINANYRISKEYLLDQQNVRSAREALLRRVLAVQNIAATGTAAVSPEALIFDMERF